MEISKTIEYANSLSEKIKNAYKKDIEISINKLFEEFDVYKRGTNTLVVKNELINIFMNPKLEIKYCSSATKAGTKCKHKALDNSNFCAKHLYSTENLRNLLHKQQTQQSIEIKTENLEKDSEFYIIENKLKTHNNTLNNTNNNLQNVLIENAFYYTNDIWIYDKESMEKVGYIENNNYILTSDPFILQNF